MAVALATEAQEFIKEELVNKLMNASRILIPVLCRSFVSMHKGVSIAIALTHAPDFLRENASVTPSSRTTTHYSRIGEGIKFHMLFRALSDSGMYQTRACRTQELPGGGL